MKTSKQVGVYSLYSLECHQYVNIPLVVDQTVSNFINDTFNFLYSNNLCFRANYVFSHLKLNLYLCIIH